MMMVQPCPLCFIWLYYYLYCIVRYITKWMGWIFDTCTDQYGACIRQYVNFSLCLIVLVLALYSCLRTYQTERVNFQLLPLAINTIASLVLLILDSQMQIFNIRIVLLIIEIYSYFILCYSFVFMVLKANFQYQNKEKTIKLIFYVVSIIALIAIISTFILSMTGVVTCQEDQGLGSIVVISLEFPLLLITFVYSSKSKKLIINLSNILKTKRQDIAQTQHLIEGEDTYLELKFLQLKFVRFAFIVSMVLHIIELCCYYIGNQEIICLARTNEVQITNALELYILCIQNLSELFPHFIIPFIFWYIPAKIYHQKQGLFQNSIYGGLQDDSKQVINQSRCTSNGIKLAREQSKLVPDLQNEQVIRQKLIRNTMSPAGSIRKTSF